MHQLIQLGQMVVQRSLYDTQKLLQVSAPHVLCSAKFQRFSCSFIHAEVYLDLKFVLVPLKL